MIDVEGVGTRKKRGGLWADAACEIKLLQGDGVEEKRTKGEEEEVR